MPDDINHLDTNDEGLKGIFGDRFHDATEGIATPVCGLVRNDSGNAISKKEKTTHTAKAAQRATEKPVDAQWEPTKENTWYDNLKACTKWAALFGGLSCLIFYWEAAGLMAESISVPCMCVCTALAGWGVGKNATRGTK